MIPLLARWGLTGRVGKALAVLIPLALVFALLALHLRSDAALKRKLEAATETVRAFKDANAKWKAAALAQKLAAEAKSRADAERITREHASLVADTRTAADRFISANRLRGPVCPGGGGAAPAAKNHGAELHADLPADPVVLGASDVRACAEWVAFGLKARDWGLGLAAER